MKRTKNNIWTNILLFGLLVVKLSCYLRLLYPISFCVIRYSSIAVNFDSYLTNLGYPSLDSNGNNVGYNIIAIDGYKTTTTVDSLPVDVSPLGTWVNVYQRILGNVNNAYGRNSADVQKNITSMFHQRAAKILLNAFSNEHPVSQQKSNATYLALDIARYISSYTLDGVSIDFDDFHSVQQQTASEWLRILLKNLRLSLGNQKVIALQIPATFINFIDLFKNPLINSYVDIFIIKYYNVLNQDYNSFNTIFIKSPTYNKSSIWQIQKSSQIKIDVCKTIVAKPALSSGTWNSNSFIQANALGNILGQAMTNFSWFGGYANLDFGADSLSQYQLAALNTIRTYCNRFQTCYCR